ncbi:CsgG/HfaB family protein [Treponema primitia]|uniref:hypothetical protein n=1 Tax=Treponema primitia TaxID=88058 RepID=UPI00398162C9
MKRIVSIFAALLLLGCASAPQDPARVEFPQDAPLIVDGKDGAGIRIAILQPTVSSLPDSESWMPVLIQGILTGDFNIFSRMTVLDRLNLDVLLAEQSFSTAGNFSDEDYIRIGRLLNAQYILAGSIVKIISNEFFLQLAVVDTETGIRKASFTKTCILTEIRDTSVIKDASYTLLSQLGVVLTNTGKAALYKIQAAKSESVPPTSGTNTVPVTPAPAANARTVPAAAISASAVDTGFPMITVVEKRKHFVLNNAFGFIDTRTRDDTFNPFSISKDIVPFELWFDVFEWAVTQGYVFTRNGREGRSGEVYGIDIQNAFVWCNALSEYSDIAPYYANAQGGVLKNAGFHGNLTEAISAGTGFWEKIKKQNNSGYRLPTYWEAELVHVNLALADMDKLLIEPWTSGNSLTNAYNIGWQRLDSSNGFRVVRDHK